MLAPEVETALRSPPTGLDSDLLSQASLAQIDAWQQQYDPSRDINTRPNILCLYALQSPQPTAYTPILDALAAKQLLQHCQGPLQRALCHVGSEQVSKPALQALVSRCGPAETPLLKLMLASLTGQLSDVWTRTLATGHILQLLACILKQAAGQCLSLPVLWPLHKLLLLAVLHPPGPVMQPGAASTDASSATGAHATEPEQQAPGAGVHQAAQSQAAGATTRTQHALEMPPLLEGYLQLLAPAKGAVHTVAADSLQGCLADLAALTVSSDTGGNGAAQEGFAQDAASNLVAWVQHLCTTVRSRLQACHAGRQAERPLSAGHWRCLLPPLAACRLVAGLPCASHTSRQIIAPVLDQASHADPVATSLLAMALLHILQQAEEFCGEVLEEQQAAVGGAGMQKAQSNCCQNALDMLHELVGAASRQRKPSGGSIHSAVPRALLLPALVCLASTASLPGPLQTFLSKRNSSSATSTTVGAQRRLVHASPVGSLLVDIVQALLDSSYGGFMGPAVTGSPPNTHAPEAVASGEQSGCAALWALGCVLWPALREAMQRQPYTAAFEYIAFLLAPYHQHMARRSAQHRASAAGTASSGSVGLGFSLSGEQFAAILTANPAYWAVLGAFLPAHAASNMFRAHVTAHIAAQRDCSAWQPEGHMHADAEGHKAFLAAALQSSLQAADAMFMCQRPAATTTHYAKHMHSAAGSHQQNHRHSQQQDQRRQQPSQTATAWDPLLVVLQTAGRLPGAFAYLFPSHVSDQPPADTALQQRLVAERGQMLLLLLGMIQARLGSACAAPAFFRALPAFLDHAGVQLTGPAAMADELCDSLAATRKLLQASCADLEWSGSHQMAAAGVLDVGSCRPGRAVADLLLWGLHAGSSATGLELCQSQGPQALALAAPAAWQTSALRQAYTAACHLHANEGAALATAAWVSFLDAYRRIDHPSSALRKLQPPQEMPAAPLELNATTSAVISSWGSSLTGIVLSAWPSELVERLATESSFVVQRLLFEAGAGLYCSAATRNGGAERSQGAGGEEDMEIVPDTPPDDDGGPVQADDPGSQAGSGPPSRAITANPQLAAAVAANPQAAIEYACTAIHTAILTSSTDCASPAAHSTSYGNLCDDGPKASTSANGLSEGPPLQVLRALASCSSHARAAIACSVWERMRPLLESRMRDWSQNQGHFQQPSPPTWVTPSPQASQLQRDLGLIRALALALMVTCQPQCGQMLQTACQLLVPAKSAGALPTPFAGPEVALMLQYLLVSSPEAVSRHTSPAPFAVAVDSNGAQPAGQQSMDAGRRQADEQDPTAATKRRKVHASCNQPISDMDVDEPALDPGHGHGTEATPPTDSDSVRPASTGAILETLHPILQPFLAPSSDSRASQRTSASLRGHTPAPVRNGAGCNAAGAADHEQAAPSAQSAALSTVVMESVVSWVLQQLASGQSGTGLPLKSENLTLLASRYPSFRAPLTTALQAIAEGHRAGEEAAIGHNMAGAAQQLLDELDGGVGIWLQPGMDVRQMPASAWRKQSAATTVVLLTAALASQHPTSRSNALLLVADNISGQEQLAPALCWHLASALRRQPLTAEQHVALSLAVRYLADSMARSSGNSGTASSHASLEELVSTGVSVLQQGLLQAPLQHLQHLASTVAVLQCLCASAPAQMASSTHLLPLVSTLLDLICLPSQQTSAGAEPMAVHPPATPPLRDACGQPALGPSELHSPAPDTALPMPVQAAVQTVMRLAAVGRAADGDAWMHMWDSVQHAALESLASLAVHSRAAARAYLHKAMPACLRGDGELAWQSSLGHAQQVLLAWPVWGPAEVACQSGNADDNDGSVALPMANIIKQLHADNCEHAERGMPARPHKPPSSRGLLQARKLRRLAQLQASVAALSAYHPYGL